MTKVQANFSGHITPQFVMFPSKEQLKDVAHHAYLLGIRVVPEIDLPGHASSIAVAYPELMSENKEYKPEHGWGVFEPLLDPSDEMVYKFIDDLVGEIATIFEDEYVHIGGDEVNPKQWIQNNLRVLIEAILGLRIFIKLEASVVL